MKKYMTVAALLAAGTAFSNAAVVLTTTFDNCNQSTATSVTLTNTGLDGVSASLSSLTDGNGGTLSLLTSGDAGGLATFFSPSANVGTGTSWTATFDYSFGSEEISLASVQLGYNLFSATGGWQSATVTRYFDITLTVTDTDTNSELGTFSLSNLTATGKGVSELQTATLSSSSESEVKLTGNVQLTLKVERNSSNTDGCFFGVGSIGFDNGAVIPEPSAFGLLAGVGALALVAARRRRTK